ncbi:DNA helicase [Thermaurantimonas aggregans]|uniref:DNA 3'-5' helicase n=1 Tax=Thermaurantimonas aggregans TaxID=2173829 RepID=A0A401XN97_9FLAO|nr:UvrD-helicase domain-containing protein [Thermaurantimonas aggregans]MCX8149773.1 UvrD-helicase domain-containing protein [Thermaurantimonas aggregans]GCD78489.1 DNA helicase [Thermaurantimonas aggregans]
MNPEKLLNELNEVQRQAVVHTEGPLMIIAGAGSGKTRVLTYRIAWLMLHNIDPFNILALTFTNKAAREMKERIAQVVGASEAKNLWMGTFHSIFARLLRVDGHLLGYPSNFTIYDTDDSEKLIAQIVKERNLDKDIYKPKKILNRISNLKNNLIIPQYYDRFPELFEYDEAAKIPEFKNVYSAYVERCFKAGAMDFDDILLKTNELLGTFPEILAKYQDRFRYILVDEYQDTNHSQYIIVKALANKFENICVVGDDAQSIYAFRGANIRNILSFQKDYPDCKIFKLEQNYRSTQNIVKAANSLIAKNRDQLKKEVWTANEPGEKITIYKALDEAEEAQYIAERIMEWHLSRQMDFSNFAILYRTNAQSRALEEVLRRKNIPYRIFGGTSFYQRKEVKDMLAYLRLAVNPNDEEALRRVINYPARGIGQTTLDKLTILADRYNTTLWSICENALLYSRDLGSAIAQKVSDFATMIKGFGVMAKKESAWDVAEHIFKTSGLLRALKEDSTEEGISRLGNVQELLNSIKAFNDKQLELEADNDISLDYFLQEIALLTSADQDDKTDPNRVSLMTLHLAKGLEFPVVFIPGMEEELFPSAMMMNSRADLEEERRLFYVGITRAKKKLYLTFTHMRTRYGRTADCEPSRFLEEIDDEYTELIVPGIRTTGPTFLGGVPNLDGLGISRPYKSNFISSKQTLPPNFPPGIRPLQPSETPAQKLNSPSEPPPQGEFTTDAHPGDRVYHQKFGYGKVLSVEGTGVNKKASVAFDQVGEKKLLLQYAKLIKVTS